MKSNELKKVIRLQEGVEQLFEFEADTQYHLNFADFKASKLTGVLNNTPKEINKNFENCTLSELDIQSINLDACDFLDTTVNSCNFEYCNFNGTHFYSCMVFDSTFSDVKISLTNFSENYFENCTFINCEFHRFIFKKCEFINCKFINCSTTNKLFDLCYFNQTYFENIELQLETITDNLGIKKELCSNVNYRTARSYEQFKLIPEQELNSELFVKSKSGLALIASSYYFYGHNENTYNSVMRILESTDWLKSRVSSSVAADFTILAKFLIGSYNNQEMILLPLIKFQDYLNELTEIVNSNSSQSSFAVIQTLNGLRMQISKYTTEFVELMTQYEHIMSHAKRLSLDCRGPVKSSFFEKILEHVGSDVRVESVKVRNSPLDVVITCVTSISCWFVLSAILSTRYKESLTKYDPDSKKMKSLPVDLKTMSNDSPLVVHKKRTIGPLDTKDKEIGIQVVTLYSDGLCKRLHLGFSFKRAMEFNKHILGIRKSFDENGTEL